MDHDHAGIPCSIVKGADVCSAIDTVVTSIRDKFPEDFARLRDRIVRFENMPAKDVKDDVYGEWCKSPPRKVMHPSFQEIVDEGDDQRQGVLRLIPNAVVATVAHELGHVVATEADYWDRRAPDVLEDGYKPGGFWGNESTADYHAFRWGFEELIRAQHGNRSDDYPPLPGDPPVQIPESSWLALADDNGRWWQVDDDFVFHYCSVCAPDADGCAHALEECVSVSTNPDDYSPEEIEAIRQQLGDQLGDVTIGTPDD